MKLSAGFAWIGIALAVAASPPGARAETRYVSLAGLHVAPFTNWTEAATNFQDAIAACAPGDVVVASNGTYALTATVRITNGVTLVSAAGRDATQLDAGALPAGQDAVFLQFGTLDGFTVSNAPRNGVKSEFGAVANCLVTHSRGHGIDSYTTPRIVSNSTLVVSNTLVQKSATNGIYTCAVDTRIVGCTIAQSGGTGIALQQNDTLGVKQVPRVSNFLVRASTVSSNQNCGIAAAFWNYLSSLPAVPVRIEDCVVEDNVGKYGGGIADTGGEYADRSSGLTVSGCVVRRNTATAHGGGVWFWNSRAPAIDHSIIEDNFAGAQGGGACLLSGTMQNCLVRSNACGTDGGGVYGGSLANNTIVGNRANRGGGTFASDLRNCIVYYNAAASGSNAFGGALAYTCTAPAAAGEGNIASVPGFAGYRNWRLVAGSPCVDRGDFGSAAGDFDLDGDPRIWGGNADMGCDEFYPPGLVGPLSVAVAGNADRAVVGATVSFRCDVEGAPEAYVWNFSDGYSVSNVPFVDRVFAAPGAYLATVLAWNVDGAASNAVAVEIFPGYTNYVSLAGAHVSPFTNWTDAATNVQDAVAANIPGGVVRVADGTYDAGGVAWNGGLTNRIAITGELAVVSVNGPDFARIVGQGPVGDAAVRCAYVAAGARLSGFTLADGHTRASGDEDLDQSGGGAWCETGGLVENCVIQDCVANRYGGGMRNGTVRNSILRANAAGYGGGAHGGTLANALLVGNQADYGGGAAAAVLLHATVVGNQAGQAGGGTYRGMASNSIVYFNSAAGGWSNYFNTVCRYSCTYPDPLSTGNVTNDPRFADAAHGNYRLGGDSPAVDAAEATDLATDLLGAPRPLPGAAGGEPAPDMGAYEYTAVHYVSPAGGNVAPYLTWAEAAHDLQAAIDAADPLDVVFVSNGVYAAGGRVHGGALTNRATIALPIRVEAVNGPLSAAIEGAGPVGDAAIRGVYLGTNAALVGFTVRHGATRAAGDAVAEQSGGGIWAAAGAVVSNCIVVSNAANALGGGAYGGDFVNAFLTANAAAQGGGLARGTAAYCTLVANAAADGGGAFESTGRCSIVYFNSATGAGANVLGGAWETCCTLPDPGGLGNFTNDPALLAPNDYQLAAGSPCIDAGPAAAPFPGDDLDSVPRPLDGDANGEARPDVGAFEFIHPTADTDGDGLGDRDEIGASGTDPRLADTDGDAQSDLIELVSGMDPLDPASFFAILDAATAPAGQVFSWPGRAGRLYTIVAAEGAGGAMTNWPAYVDRPGMDGAMVFTNAAPERVQRFGVRVRLAP